MPNRIELPADEISRAYRSGVSQKALAERFGVSRRPIERVLIASGVDVRGPREANRLMMTARSPEENRRNCEAAHRAAKGRKHSVEERCKMAIGRERAQAGIGPHELTMKDLLESRGVTFAQQKAIGPYNCDFAVGSVAVEVFGGYFHWFGRHLARLPKRLHYFADRGLDTWIVNVGRRAPITSAALDDLVAFLEASSGNPSPGRQYRVIWGTGQFVSAASLHDDQIATIEALKSAADSVRPRKGSRW